MELDTASEPRPATGNPSLFKLKNGVKNKRSSDGAVRRQDGTQAEQQGAQQAAADSRRAGRLRLGAARALLR